MPNIELTVSEDSPIELSVSSDSAVELGIAEQIISGGGGGNYQDKTVSFTPTESAQTQTVHADAGYDALDDVTVNVAAIDDEYVGSAVPRKSSSDLSASGATVTAPAGYYENAVSKSVASGTAGKPTAGKNAVQNHSISLRPMVTNTEGYISGGLKLGDLVTVDVSELVSGTKSITSNGTGIDVTEYAAVDVAVPSGSPTLQTKSVSYTPTTSSQTAQVTADQGYDGLDAVNVSVAAMPSGTAGTPTATKGTVSNHSVSVTPSVTNTTGYITGSTKTGTAVSVSASELVSGNLPITQNGNNIDVANYSTVSVSVSGGSVQYDTKTATASDYPTSLSFSSMKGEPKAFVLRLNAQVSSSGSTTYYYIVDVSHFGTTTHGNCFRIGSTRRVDNITSGYSYSYSNGTLTISSSASSRSASPGAFYSGSYELLYAY